MLLKCPKCGNITSTEPLTIFPFCGKCREYLLKCRYCRFYDYQAYQCAHSEVRAFVSPGDEIPGSDPDAMTECEYFQLLPRMIYTPLPAWKRFFLFAARVTPIAFLVVVLGYSALLVTEVYRRPRSAIPAPAVEVTTDLPPEMMEVAVGRAFVVRAFVRNLTREEISPIDIYINEHFFDLCELRMVTPMPQSMDILRGRRLFSYGGLPPNGLMVFEIRCRPVREGRIIFVLTVKAPRRVIYKGPRRVYIYAI